MIYENGALKQILLPIGYYQNGTFYYYLKDHLGNNRVTINSSGAVVEKSHYYPSGTRFFTESTSNSLNPIPFRYNGKEMETMNGLNLIDYGARRRFAGLPIWTGRDEKAELYKNLSPYCYAANNPVNAIDPDGHVVIFINGQHTGNGGSSSYWYDSNSNRHFDKEVMTHFNDNTSSRHQYLDGALGGWFNNTLAAVPPWMSNLHADNRESAGLRYGRTHAKEILESLHRTNGVIDESLKIVSHSMGAAYSKGFVRALMEVAWAYPKLSKGLKISMFDFDPFQASELTAVPKVHTQQFTHNGKKKGKWYDFFNPMVNIADEQQQGVKNSNPNGDNNDYIESPTEKNHSITTFFGDISKMEEGTYKWNGTQWVKQ